MCFKRWNKVNTMKILKLLVRERGEKGVVRGGERGREWGREWGRQLLDLGRDRDSSVLGARTTFNVFSQRTP